MESIPVISYFLIFIMAFLYASVGHGGASGYLAVLSMLGVSVLVMKPSALLLNILVSGISFIQFYRSGYFRFQLFWPFAVTSVPAAVAGTLFQVTDGTYKKILGICLLISVLRIVFISRRETEDGEIKKLNQITGLLSGAIIGFISGILGIGGGILLSPLLLFLKVARIKETAAVSAVFILVNSLSGLGAFLTTGEKIPVLAYHLLAAAGTGGLLGSYLGSQKFNFRILKYLLAAVLSIAGLKLISI